MNKVGILGTGVYIPERVVSNNDLEGIVRDYDAEKSGMNLDAWIQKYYGVKERRWGPADEMPSEQAAKAALHALENANMTAGDIDFIILNTSFGDYVQPTTAALVQRIIKMRSNTFALELNMPCPGGVYSMVVAYNFIATGRYKTGLVLGVDKMSGLVNHDKFMLTSLFGEGAGAVVLSASGKESVVDYYLGSKGEEGDEKEYASKILAGGAKHPASAKTVANEMHHLSINGDKIARYVDYTISDTIHALLERNELTLNDIRYIVPHQAGYKTVLKGTRLAGIPDEKVVFTLHKYGNTSAASTLITLHELHSLEIQPNDLVIMVGMGSGLNWGGVLIKW